ncbi:MAG: carbonic anhydrase [Oligoflexia bacterium]|nr:carbonic anhydrase [Oligoflexia bacterium]
MKLLNKKTLLSSSLPICLLLSFSLAISTKAKARDEDEESGSAAATAVEGKPAPTAMDAYRELEQGNKRFVQNRMIHPKQDQFTRSLLSSGQKPNAIVLSCSDSRVPPEILFDQGLGQIFVVRTAGQVADSIAIGSIEYALEHLGTRLLIVLGHDSCGAVKATLATPPGKSSGSLHIDRIIESIRQNLGPINENAPLVDSKLISKVRDNVNAEIKALIAKSHIIREFIDKGELVIASGIYHLDSGEVEFWSAGVPIIIDALPKMRMQQHTDRPPLPPQHLESAGGDRDRARARIINRKILYSDPGPGLVKSRHH